MFIDVSQQESAVSLIGAETLAYQHFEFSESLRVRLAI
jgi:hypothetical protein